MAHLRSKQHLETTAPLTKQVCVCERVCMCAYMYGHLHVQYAYHCCRLTMRVDRLWSVGLSVCLSVCVCIQYIRMCASAGWGSHCGLSGDCCRLLTCLC